MGWLLKYLSKKDSQDLAFRIDIHYPRHMPPEYRPQFRAECEQVAREVQERLER